MTPAQWPRRWHAASAQSSELRGDSELPVGVRAPHRCPPAPLPRPLPLTPLLILMPVARNAGGALCAGRSALQKGAGGGPTGVSDTMQALAKSEFLEHHASPMPLSQERHHKHTRHHKSHSTKQLLPESKSCPVSQPLVHTTWAERPTGHRGFQAAARQSHFWGETSVQGQPVRQRLHQAWSRHQSATHTPPCCTKAQPTLHHAAPKRCPHSTMLH